jgi:hypothetical protein
MYAPCGSGTRPEADAYREALSRIEKLEAELEQKQMLIEVLFVCNMICFECFVCMLSGLFGFGENVCFFLLLL